MRGKHVIAMSDDAKKRAIASLQRYTADHLKEPIGDLKATLLLQFILEEIGPTIYNQAIVDARTFFEERAADLEGICYHAEFPYWAGE